MYCPRSLEKCKGVFQLSRKLGMRVSMGDVEEMDEFFKKQEDTEWDQTAGEDFGIRVV